MEVIDNGPEPRGKFANTTSEDSELIDEEQLLDALAADLKGKRWDSEQGDWQ